MELAGLGARIESPTLLPDLAVPLDRDPRHGPCRGRRRGGGAPKGSVSEERRETVDQPIVPARIQRLQEHGACVAAARLEHADQRIQCTYVLTADPFIRPSTKLPDPNIQISNRAQDLTQPSEIRPEPARPDREGRFEDPKDRAEPPRRYPHPMELLRIFPESRARLVREHLDEEPPEHRERQLPG